MFIDRANIFSSKVSLRLGEIREDFLRNRVHSRPFSRRARKNILLITLPDRIPQSQIHPFHVYATEIQRRYGTEIREIGYQDYLLGSQPGLDNASMVCFQTNFDIPQADLDHLLGLIRRRNPKAALVFLDWYAPTDLRLATTLDPHVDLYVKKHILADRSLYGKPTRGDTNLTDYYGPRYAIDMPETVFDLPAGFFDKLVLGPSFVTAPFLMPLFRKASVPAAGGRDVDVNARLTAKGTDWYQRMRLECNAATEAMQNLRVAMGTGLSLAAFLHELKRSKICFSPFGYGEVCWRDFEAVAQGAVLLKQDMSHVHTEPNIFRASETYMPVKWDLSDFSEKLDLLLGDELLRKRLSSAAFELLHDYVTKARFVSQMERLFA